MLTLIADIEMRFFWCLIILVSHVVVYLLITKSILTFKKYILLYITSLHLHFNITLPDLFLCVCFHPYNLPKVPTFLEIIFQMCKLLYNLDAVSIVWFRLFLFLFHLQQLEQIQKELSVLEEDIKRVEVSYQEFLWQFFNFMKLSLFL